MVSSRWPLSLVRLSVALLGLVNWAAARPFLGDISARLESEKTLRSCNAATTEVLGPGHGASSVELLQVYSDLLPALDSLPKCEQGRFALSTVQYLLHRYFMQTHGVSIRGFEPHRQANATVSGLRLLGAPAPYLELLSAGRLAEHGFTPADVVALVILLQRLLREAGGVLLEAAYELNFWDAKDVLTLRALAEVVDTYFYHWLRGHNKKELKKKDFERNREKGSMKSWVTGIDLVFGHFDLDKWRSAAIMNPFVERKYSFSDVEAMMYEVSMDFGDIWAPECLITREKIEELDEKQTGRIPLMEFHELAQDHDLEHFSETKRYLKDLGALDMSSPQLGPRVVIPNYLDSLSNCVVANRQYSVCCASPCEPILNRLEQRIRAPVADADTVFSHVVRIIDEDPEGEAPRALGRELKGQLQRIAETHRGQVPLHGRLFAQWLHYVFPRVCPFPYQTGEINPKSKNELDGVERTKVKEKDIDKEEERAERRAKRWAASEEGQNEVWMSQWSDDEELLAEYIHLRPPWEVPTLSISPSTMGAVVLLCGLVLLTRVALYLRKTKHVDSWQGKSHCV